MSVLKNTQFQSVEPKFPWNPQNPMRGNLREAEMEHLLEEFNKLIEQTPKLSVRVHSTTFLKGIIPSRIWRSLSADDKTRLKRKLVNLYNKKYSGRMSVASTELEVQVLGQISVEEAIRRRENAAKSLNDGSYMNLVSPPVSPPAYGHRSPPASPVAYGHRSPPASPVASGHPHCSGACPTSTHASDIFSSNEDPESKDDTLCKTCKKNQCDTVLKPCTHFCMCHECAKNTKTCPLCKEFIQRRIHLRPVSPYPCSSIFSESESESDSDSEDSFEDRYIATCKACGYTWDGNAQHICESPERLIYLKQADPPFDTEKVASDIDEIVNGYITKEADERYIIEFQASDRIFANFRQKLEKINIKLDQEEEYKYQAKLLDISPYRFTLYQYGVPLENYPYKYQAVVSAAQSVLDYDNAFQLDGAYTFMKRGTRESFVKAAAALASKGLKLEKFLNEDDDCDIVPMDSNDPRYAKINCVECEEEMSEGNEYGLCEACEENYLCRTCGDMMDMDVSDRHDECETCRLSEKTCDGCGKVVSRARDLIDKGEGEKLCETCSRVKHPEDWIPKKVTK